MTRRRAAKGSTVSVIAPLLVSFSAGCGDPYALTATAGMYWDGSGQTSLAALITFRDFSGQGPQEVVGGTIFDGQHQPVATFQYDAPGDHSALATWWPDVPVSPQDRFSIELANWDDRADLVIASDAPLEAPAADLSAGGNTIAWNSVAGATGYGCRVTQGGAIQLSSESPAESCDLSVLPSGSYAASVMAYTSPPVAAAQRGGQRPDLGTRFDVSEARLAFILGAVTGDDIQVRALGGGIHYGGGSPGLTVWLSFTHPDGTPDSSAWVVDLTGPGLTQALRVTYPPGARAHLAWAYDAAAIPGIYSFIATSADSRQLSSRFSVGEVPPLQPPTDVVAEDRGLGGAAVSWTPVPGAQSYLVSVFAGGAFVTGQWFTGSSAAFPTGSFTSGTRYDVYVAATVVDIQSATPPAAVVAAENTYFPASFVAR